MNKFPDAARQQGGREMYRMNSDNGYTNITYEFKSRRGARDFMRMMNACGESLYAPFFCDVFKLARVTIFVKVEASDEQIS